MHEKNKYRHIPWNRYNLEKYRDTDFWSYRPALVAPLSEIKVQKLSLGQYLFKVHFIPIKFKYVHFRVPKWTL